MVTDEMVDKAIDKAVASLIDEHPMGHWRGDQVKEVARRAIAALSAADPIGVRCTGCGSPWTDEDLAYQKSRRPGLLSCCPERKMIPVYASPPAPSVPVKASKDEKLISYVMENMDWSVFGDENDAEVAQHAANSAWSRIRSALSAQVQDVAGWRPIETAPKERQQRVLLTLPNGRVTEGWWGAAKYNRSKKEYDLAWVSSPYSGDVSPTHWMPLPAAPAKQEG